MARNDKFWQKMPSINGGHNFLQNSIQKVLKYTGPLYSTRSLQIRGVFEVQWHVQLVGGANSHKQFRICKNFQFWGSRHASQKLNLSGFSDLHDIVKAFDCLHVVRSVHALAHRKHPGFEEISSSRCAQYILKVSRSKSEESYDLQWLHQGLAFFCKNLSYLAISHHFLSWSGYRLQTLKKTKTI